MTRRRDPLRITAALLRRHVACADQVATFLRQWPDGVVSTARTVPVVVRLGLDATWAAARLLTPEALAEYREAEAKFAAMTEMSDG